MRVFGGHALYVKDGKLKYAYNFVGNNEQIVDSTVPIPTGPVVLSAAFEREGTGMPTTGTLSLYVNDDKVGEGRIVHPARQLLVGRRGLERGARIPRFRSRATIRASVRTRSSAARSSK